MTVSLHLVKGREGGDFKQNEMYLISNRVLTAAHLRVPWESL